MSTNRIRLRRTPREETDPALIAWMRDAGPAPVAHYFMSDAAVRALWDENKAAILAEWITGSPGTRPSMWWRFDAPEPRRRLAGAGTSRDERYAYAPAYHLGLPIAWAEEGFDPADPPRFESQAAYLRRHGLFLPGEISRAPTYASKVLPRDLWP